MQRDHKAQFHSLYHEQAGGWVLCVSPEESDVEEVEEAWEEDSCMEKARHCFASRGVEVSRFLLISPIELF